MSARFRPFITLVAVLSIFFVSVLDFHVAAAQGRRVALVIGESKYQYAERLRNPSNDAALVAQTLSGLGFTLIGGRPYLDLGRPAFDDAIRAFGQSLRGADAALFYYSGHGMQVRGANWLIPVDANPTRVQDLDFQLIDAELVLRQMEGSGTKLNVMILDACRNNPFGGRGVRDMSPGLAVMSVPEGTVISYATQPGSVASDGSGSNSPYTEALAGAMRRPGLDVLQMFNQVGLAVKRSTAGDQQPWVAASPIEGQFYFAGPSSVGPAPAPAQVVSPPAVAGPGTVTGNGRRCETWVGKTFCE